MEIEFEATFIPVDKDVMKGKLQKVGAELLRPEFLQKRTVFHLPPGHEIPGSWLRVRDEGDKITMSLKTIDGDKIENQRELGLTVSNFADAVEFLKKIGCVEKGYQETKRELWKLGTVEITIDEWPFLEPFVEIEGLSEDAVHKVADSLEFDWHKAKFCAIGTLYSEKYKISQREIDDNTSRIVFEGTNPFIDRT